MQTIRTVPFRNDFADWIFKLRNRFAAASHIPDTRLGHGQPVDEGRRHPSLMRIGKIQRIGCQNLVRRFQDIAGHADEGCMFSFGRSNRQRSRRRTRLAAHCVHQAQHILLRVCFIQHQQTPLLRPFDQLS